MDKKEIHITKNTIFDNESIPLAALDQNLLKMISDLVSTVTKMQIELNKQK